VMGEFAGAFGSHVVVDSRLVATMPAGWSFARAASVPVAFLTAWYGLVELGGLRAGESVLVHAAAGGVGMAAVQVARLVGAEVFATASPGKWAVLRAAGIDDDHIASSRDPGFEEKFRRVSGGRGVDVVLDALAGELVDAGLRLLTRGGRFLEMGKTDIRDAKMVAERFGVSYQAFDLMDADPERIHELLVMLVGALTRGELAPLPVRAWDVRQAREAFRFVSQARHVGKVVLTIPREWDPDGWVVISGGTGTLGRLVARRLAEQGARRLLLLSRRGPHAPGADELLAALRDAGASVDVVACDVADREQLAAVLGHARQSAPLTAVVHAAGITDDVMSDALTTQRLAGVMAAKAIPPWNLHELTAEDDLAGFVLFSSPAGVFGSAGQAAYAAANATLDALAAFRRHAGLPATSIAWGLCEQRSDITARLTDVDRARMRRNGVLPLPTPAALDLFDAARHSHHPVVIAAHLTGALAHRTGAPAPRTATTAPSAGHVSGVISQLTVLRPAERDLAILNLIRAQAAIVLGHTDSGIIEPHQPFLELGFDSLTAVELRNRLSTTTGLHLSATLTFDHPTPHALAESIGAMLAESLDGSSHPRAATVSAETADSPAAGPVAALYQRACGLGRFPEALDMLKAISRLQPTFSAEDAAGAAPEPVRLARGAGQPHLFCFPSITPAAGPHEYARFAGNFRDLRDVTVLPEPGFVSGELLPADVAALTRCHAESLLRAAADAPFVLLGRSAGGWIAHAVADELGRLGAPPAGIVLIDTYSPSRSREEWLGASASEAMIDRENAFTMLHDNRLTAMGGYFRVFSGWEPSALDIPTLLVRAVDPWSTSLAEMTGANGEWRASWHLPRTTTKDVAGNHFTMLEEHSGTTAQAVDEWLAGLF
jgi:NADPH:quinone reductase-like Zn-dependent oxidoreductase/NAD(P)-dependent dehydrogenase (short-subunit alcohol dehydrogenase family)